MPPKALVKKARALGARNNDTPQPVYDYSSAETIMKQLVWTSLALCGGLLVGGTALAVEGNAENGESLYAPCAVCHGAAGQGNRALSAPATGGQNEWYVLRQLTNFRNDIRGAHAEDVYGGQMRPMAMTLANDQAVADVAAYIATLPRPRPPATVDGDPKVGKALYVSCIACHGANGEGDKILNAPRISEQHDWYIVRQIQNFKKGIRGTHASDIRGAQMRPMAETLKTEQAEKDVAAYINSLPE